MLSDQNRPVIEATLPVVGQHIGEIARRFYGHLFAAHPELLDGIVQPRQPGPRRAAAGAGRARSRRSPTALVDDPERAARRICCRRIAHKHASLGIRPDQYQVVHDNLMWAIVDVLGDAVTPQVAAAWDEVYWLMANALINQERGLYSARGVRPGDRVAAVAGREEDPRDRGRRDLRRQAGRRPAGEDLAARPVRHGARCRCPTGCTSPASTASPAPTTASTASSRSSGCTAAASPTGRSRRCCTTRSASATC